MKGTGHGVARRREQWLAAGGAGRRLARLLVAFGTCASMCAAAAELPPEIQADRYLVQAELQLEAGQAIAAVATLDKIVALQRDHGLEIPAAFWFRHAQASLDAGLVAQAVKSATEYLNETGRDGEYYRESLQILAAVELAKTTPGGVFRDSLQSGGEGPEMVVIPAGRFRMGCLSNDDACFSDEKPVHGVTIGRPFALSDLPGDVCGVGRVRGCGRLRWATNLPTVAGGAARAR